jgi:hypothetical protein
MFAFWRASPVREFANQQRQLDSTISTADQAATSAAELDREVKDATKKPLGYLAMCRDAETLVAYRRAGRILVRWSVEAIDFACNHTASLSGFNQAVQPDRIDSSWPL